MRWKDLYDLDASKNRGLRNESTESPKCKKLAILSTCTCGSTSYLSTYESLEDDKQELPKSIASIMKSYDKLIIQWQVERKNYSQFSQIERYWTGPVGKQIIEMGPRILPLIVKELRKGDFFFNYPMQVFAGFRLGGNEVDSEQERSKLWIKWYDELSQLK